MSADAVVLAHRARLTALDGDWLGVEQMIGRAAKAGLREGRWYMRLYRRLRRLVRRHLTHRGRWYA